MNQKSDRFTIALADDDADDRFLFAMALKEVTAKTELQTFINGVDLMETLAQPGIELPGIIFMDFNMPKKNGLQCLEEIHNDERLQSIPVVILSTSVNQNEINRVYDNGAILYCRKPTEFSKLVELIEQVLSMDLVILKQLVSFNQVASTCSRPQ